LGGGAEEFPAEAAIADTTAGGTSREALGDGSGVIGSCIDTVAVEVGSSGPKTTIGCEFRGFSPLGPSGGLPLNAVIGDVFGGAERLRASIFDDSGGDGDAEAAVEDEFDDGGLEFSFPSPSEPLTPMAGPDRL
jgi:hypothetical protein